ncbi:MAG: ABC transporter substrate-binding protein [Firmicutes bacterium]|nr:ABC transporter substrate-binding protein [Bacillota bacterium]
MNKRIYMLIVASLLLAGLVFAVGTSASAGEKVYIVGSTWYGHAPAWVAIEKGWFTEAGFDAEYKFVANSTDRLNAVSSGSALFASMGEIAMITPMTQGNRNFYWVGSQDMAPGFEGIVARDYIKSIADLKGKKVAVQFASSVDLTLYLLAKEHGLDSYRDIRLINMSYGEMYAALASGNIDAAAIWEPTLSKLLELPGTHLLGKDTDTIIYKKFKSMTGPDVLVINRKFVDQSPERARKFLEAYFRGVEFVRDHPEEAAKLCQKYIPDQSVEKIAKGLKGFVWLDAEDQFTRVFTEDGLYGQIEYVIDFLKNTAKRIYVKPNYKEWVRTDILPVD